MQDVQETRIESARQRVFHQLNLVNKNPYPRSEYLKKALWEIVQRVLVRPSYRRADNWRRFWLRRFGAVIPDTSVVKNGVRITHPWLFRMGEWSCVAENAHIYNLGPVAIGDHSVVSQNAHLCAGTHDYCVPSLPLIRAEIRVGSGVWICADAFIGPGVTIGDNSIVGARGVVTRDVPVGVIVAGNPARVIRDRPMPGVTDGAQSQPAGQGAARPGR